MKRRLLLVLGLLWLPLAADAGAAPTPPWNPPVIDLRVGLSQAVLRDPSLAKGVGQAGYVELQKGGVVGVLLPLPPTLAAGATPRSALSEYFRTRSALSSSERFAIGDCRRRSDRISVWFELESPNELARAPSAVGLWIERGVRVFRIGSARDNELASVATGSAAATGAGLTRVGRDVVERIFAAGASVDVSGASQRSIDEVLEIARRHAAPVIATHSNARALADRPRNLSDAAIRGIAESGGVIAVTAAHGSLAAGRPATLEHLLHQISYLVRLVGSEHVALGSGFESGAGPVRDFLAASDFPRLAVSLRSAGLSEVEVERVFFRNAQRILCADRSSP